MLYFAKVLCLILVATAMNVSAEDLSALAEEFAAKVFEEQKYFKSAYNQMDLDLTRAKFNIWEIIDRMKEEGVWSKEKALEVGKDYKIWYDEQRGNLKAIENTVKRGISESKCEVENWISMYKDGRLREVLVADLIKEVTEQLPEVSIAATYMFDDLRKDITKEIRKLESIQQSAMTSELSEDDLRKK